MKDSSLDALIELLAGSSSLVLGRAAKRTIKSAIKWYKYRVIH